jgi:hypothetical protein
MNSAVLSPSSVMSIKVDKYETPKKMKRKTTNWARAVRKPQLVMCLKRDEYHNSVLFIVLDFLCTRDCGHAFGVLQ